MKFFKRKEQVFLEYKFLCKTCDIFFYRNNPNKNKCPVCNRKSEVYSVREVGYEQYQQDNIS